MMETGSKQRLSHNSPSSPDASYPDVYPGVSSKDAASNIRNDTDTETQSDSVTSKGPSGSIDEAWDCRANNRLGAGPQDSSCQSIASNAQGAGQSITHARTAAQQADQLEGRTSRGECSKFQPGTSQSIRIASPMRVPPRTSSLTTERQDSVSRTAPSSAYGGVQAQNAEKMQSALRATKGEQVKPSNDHTERAKKATDRGVGGCTARQDPMVYMVHVPPWPAGVFGQMERPVHRRWPETKADSSTSWRRGAPVGPPPGGERPPLAAVASTTAPVQPTERQPPVTLSAKLQEQAWDDGWDQEPGDQDQDDGGSEFGYRFTDPTWHTRVSNWLGAMFESIRLEDGACAVNDLDDPPDDVWSLSGSGEDRYEVNDRGRSRRSCGRGGGQSDDGEGPEQPTEGAFSGPSNTPGQVNPMQGRSFPHLPPRPQMVFPSGGPGAGNGGGSGGDPGRRRRRKRGRGRGGGGDHDGTNKSRRPEDEMRVTTIGSDGELKVG